MFTLTSAQLGSIIDKKTYKTNETAIVNALNIAMPEANIKTPIRVCMFLAQVLHETGGFRWFTEIGSPAYFTKYDGRADLGNTEPGDGYRFRGRGFIQITGRDDYRRAGKALGLGLIEQPSLASTPTAGARIAAWYWKSRDLNLWADAGDIKTVTLKINGGLNGYLDRTEWYKKAKEALGVVVLRNGSGGPKVRALQRALNLFVDGIFGPATEQAVRLYQLDRGFTVTGIVREDMFTSLGLSGEGQGGTSA